MEKNTQISGGEAIKYDASKIIKFSDKSREEEIEDIAWKVFKKKLGLVFRRELTTEEKKNITEKEDFQYYRDEAEKIYEKKLKAVLNKKYPVIEVPASGKPNWCDGARTMLFVYSKYKGNFVLKGYLREVMEYLKKNYTHYFYYKSMWSDGFSRGSWCFWKENVGIFEPNHSRSKYREPNHKYEIREYNYLYSDEEHEQKEREKIVLKRMPKRWIPEFDKF